jgi:putative DNA methylase
MAGMPDRIKKRYVRIPKLNENAYWHSRGYLPHFENFESIQSLTFRLGDAVPDHVAERLAEEVNDEKGDTAYRKRIEEYLDAGHGSCWLGRSSIADMVKGALLFNDSRHYRLHAWVIMPNHVHVLFQAIPPHELSTILGEWKSFTAHRINHLLKRKGPLWQEEYWDRYIRNAEHYQRTVDYIRNNPVKSGLVKHAEDWPYTFISQLDESKSDRIQ